jgi:gliding motility-associated-like protein
MLLGFTAQAQLTAAFNADKTAGCSPLVVKFSDQSTGAPNQWYWDLGNGITSLMQHPTTLYFDPGTYTVKLVIRNAAGADSITKTQFITVYNSPTANFSAATVTGCYPLPVQFADLSTAGSGTITSWEWDFGDGNLSNLQNPIHTYTSAGNFNVTLRVKNNFGCSKIISKTAYIRILSGVLADFSFTAPPTCAPPTPVNFTQLATGSGISSYFWDFGDGNTSAQLNPSNIYNAAGTYTVKLRVTNAAGCVNEIVKQNVINIGTVTANFTIPPMLCENTAITFTNSSTPAAVAGQWFFSDGTSTNAVHAVKQFAAPGTYTVKLITNFGTCTDSITKTVTVVNKPQANFSINGPNGGCMPPATVQFQQQSVGAVSYMWNFGNGNTATQNIPTATYNALGTYSVSLVATAANGCTDTLVKPNYVYVGPPKINSVSGLPYKGCVPYSIGPRANITTSDPVVGYFWQFGDGSTSTDSTPVHSYAAAGTFDIKLTITTASGCKDSITVPGAVILNPKPVPAFSATPLYACAYEDIIFTNTTTGSVTGYYWDFGDGGSSSLANPTYNYNDTGFFTVTLVAINNTCRDSIIIQNYVQIKPPIASFTPLVVCDTPLLRIFENRSIGAVTYEWSFGDGTTSTDSAVSHLYPATGSYPVKLRVTNGACYHEQKDTIEIINEIPDFTISSTAFCKYALMNFTATGIDTSHILYYTWHFGNGDTLQTFSPIATYAYRSAGSFNPALTITDINGCRKTVTRTTAITVYGPTADFTNPPGTCINGTIPFTDSSRSDGIHPIVEWTWWYGDSTTQTLTAPPFQHMYSATGTYDVTLILKDNFGCTDTLQKPDAVLITKPIAAFATPDSVKCAGSGVAFTNLSSGINLQYVWNFSDGGSSIQATPTHAFATEGLYGATLTVSDIFGCRDSVTLNNIIRVANVKANFILTDSVGLCPPFLLGLTNTSINSRSVIWDFGDGSSSMLDTPSHFYNTPGTYLVKLKSFGFGNCVDSLIKPIVLRGPTGSFTYSPLSFCAPTAVNFVAQTKSNATFIWDFSDGNINSTADSTISHAYINPGKFRPKMILVDASGCQVPVVGPDTITVATVEAKISVTQTLFCDSASIQFQDSSRAFQDTIRQYQWDFGDGTVSNLQSPQHGYTQPGVYPVRLVTISGLGCTDTMYLNPTIQVINSPSIIARGDSVGCINAPVLFTADTLRSDSSALSWHWNFGNGQTATLQNPPPQLFAQLGNYTIQVIATNSSGCADTSQKSVTVHPLPVVFAGNDSTICRGDTIRLQPSGASTFAWNTDTSLSCNTCPNPLAFPTALATAYMVSGSSLQGCTATDTVVVRVVQPFAMQTEKGDTLCIGEIYQLSAFGAENYTWTPSVGLNNASLSNPIATPNTTTTYRVIGSDNAGCFTDTGFVRIVVYPIPKFSIEEDVLKVAIGSNVPIITTNSPDITKWLWQPSNGLSCTTCPQPLASPRNDITYRAIASNPGGCTAEDRVTVTVICSDGNIFIPNTFSPNGDGSNDVFYPRGKGLATVKSFKILNRWGEVIFERIGFSPNNAAYGWDGTYKGQKLSPDVFVYLAEIVCENNTLFHLKGNVTLIR